MKEGTSTAGQTDLEPVYFRDPQGEHCACPHFDRYLGLKVTCKRRYCPRCGGAWARSWRVIFRENLRAAGGPIAVIAITGPGEDLLPWACGRNHRHSGPIGCTVDREYADAWAAAAPANYRALRDAARKACRRAGHVPRLLARVWEPQKRGVPHLHIMVAVGTEEERAAAARFADELHRLAPAYFFGFVDRKLEPITAEAASRYVTSYLTGRSAKKTSIRENIADPRMPRSLLWMTPVLTRTTKVTMRRLRYARWALAAMAGKCVAFPTLKGELLGDVARVCVALERVKVLRAARGPDDVPAREREAFRHYFRTLGLMAATRPAWARTA